MALCGETSLERSNQRRIRGLVRRDAGRTVSKGRLLESVPLLGGTAALDEKAARVCLVLLAQYRR